MTKMLFREDAYLTQATGHVVAQTDAGGIVLDKSLFYPTGGGQPGDCGTLVWPGGRCAVADTVKGDGADIVCLPAEGAQVPTVGTQVMQHLDWDRRFAHMRAELMDSKIGASSAAAQATS